MTVFVFLLQVFDDEKQTQLKKHLLKTQCTELVNELVLYLADDSLIDIAENKDITPEVIFFCVNSNKYLYSYSHNDSNSNSV